VNPFEMVVIIVFLSVIASMYKSWLNNKRKQAAPADEERYTRLEQLEERVRVLERIVTDSGYDLRRQFRDLERDV
jgi:hypothetical protein